MLNSSFAARRICLLFPSEVVAMCSNFLNQELCTYPLLLSSKKEWLKKDLLSSPQTSHGVIVDPSDYWEARYCGKTIPEASNIFQKAGLRFSMARICKQGSELVTWLD